MKNIIVAFVLIISFSLSCLGQTKKKKFSIPKTVTQTINTATNSGSALSETDIINGLKEALTNASNTASSVLNQVDGFNKNMKVRIPFPPECQIVATKLRSMGFGKKVDEFETTLNRAAEQAAKDAAPIFVSAVKNMTITDAKNILTGPDTAATGYLRKNTLSSLYTAFNPTIVNALNNTLATSKWAELTTIYNKIPLVRKVDTNLPRYTTNLALKGLFVVVAEQEQKIRKDPAAQVTDLLKKVFGGK